MAEENSTQLFVPFMVDVRFGIDIQSAAGADLPLVEPLAVDVAKGEESFAARLITPSHE